MLLKHSFFCEKVNQSLTYSFARSVINIYTHCKLWQTQTHSAELGLSGVPCCWVCFFWAFFEGGGCWVTTIPSCYCCLERLLHALHLLSCQVRSVLHIDPLWYGKTWKKIDAVACDMAFISRVWRRVKEKRKREGDAPFAMRGV